MNLNSGDCDGTDIHATTCNINRPFSFSTARHDDFICPLTLEIMVVPVLTMWGHAFEQSALMRWIENKSETCPLTRKPLTKQDLVVNRPLQAKIEYWKHQQMASKSLHYEPDSSESECIFLNKLGSEMEDLDQLRKSMLRLREGKGKTENSSLVVRESGNSSSLSSSITAI